MSDISPPIFSYVRNPAEIYKQSFATVAREADMATLPQAMRPVATRLVHACGMVDILDDLAFSAGAAEAGHSALQAGKPIFCDVEMVGAGIIVARLPAKNDVICTLNDPRVVPHAAEIDNTRSAAAVDFWDERLEGAVVAIGNAPTALFRLLERIGEGGPKPALIVGIPVGFVGAVESKQALGENCSDIDFMTVHGRRGGSAMASAVVNALAAGLS